MTSHGGKRPGSGRPRGDRTERAYGIRPSSGTLARATAEGQTIAQRVDLALSVLDQIEDANMTGPVDERVRDAIATYAACDAIIGLLHETNSHRQLTPTEQEVLRLAVGEIDEREVAQLRRAVRGLRRGMTRRRNRS